MSENKDLEIIKKNFNIITESEGYDYWYDLEKEAIFAAERMVAEIERLKEEVNETQTVYYSVLKDNTRLKAELEKRPEVVDCKDCIYKNQCKADVIFQESTSKIEGPFKFYYLKFCSFGQRRESEGGKMNFLVVWNKDKTRVYYNISEIAEFAVRLDGSLFILFKKEINGLRDHIEYDRDCDDNYDKWELI